MNFALFIVLNAVLFLRPGDMIPELAAWPIYQAVMLICWVCFFPSFLQPATLRRLFAEPMTWCVIGVEISIWLSHLVHGRTYEARYGGFEFVRVVLYYLLLLGIMNSTDRLQSFLLCLVGLITLMTVISVLQFYGILNLLSYSTLLQQQGVNPESFEVEFVPRLRSLGMFNDPNDFCLILWVGMVICAYRLGSPRGLLSRVVFLLPLGLFVYALVLTQSRGGLLAVLVGGMTFLWFRWGWRRAALIGACCLPLLLAVRGRMASVSTGEDTAQERVQLWSEGLLLFRQSPLFGIGQGQFGEEVGLVAHNSYVHCFVELGLLGGVCFLGCFYIAVHSLCRQGAVEPQGENAEFRRLCPYLLAIIVGYAAGLFSLSRSYIVPTYAVLALATAYSQLAIQELGMIPVGYGRLLRGVIATSAAFLAAIHVFVRVAAQRA